MSTLKLSRRDFLKSTGISVTGLIFGYNWAAAGESGAFSPNAFIVIEKGKGVTLYIPIPEIGQNTRTALAMILSDELGADLMSVNIKQSSPRNDMGHQTAAGSQGIRRSYDNLRNSAALVREMLIAGAASHWKVSASKCRTDNSTILGPGKRKMSFEDVIPFAEKQKLPKAPKLKASSDFKYIGKPIKALDARDLAMGKTEFASDAMPDGLRFAVLVRSPVYEGKIKKYDGAAAKSMPGVIDVLRVGEAIAVTATNTWTAINAANLVNIQWDEGANSGASTAKLKEQQKAGIHNPEQKGFTKGDFDSAYKSSAIQMEEEFIAPILTHAPMETPSCTAWYHNGGVEIWSGCQSLNRLYDSLPDYTGLPREKITYHQLRIGGGFGRKLRHDYIEEALGIAKQVKYPVKLIFTREDDVRHDFYRAPDRYLYKVGLDKNGFPLAISEASARRTRITSPSDITLFFPNVIRQCTFVRPPIATGAMRAPGNNVTSFTEQSTVDIMAEKAGIDKLEYRLGLYGDKSALKRLGWKSAPSDNPLMCELIHIVKKRSGWMSDSSYGYGASCFDKYGSKIAIVALSPKSGSKPVEKVFAAVTCGRVINQLGARAQIEGGICDGLAAALDQKVELQDGRIKQSNFHDYSLLRMSESPEIDIVILKSEEAPQGLGEVSYPPMMPATVNAIFAATGRRARELPIRG
ncbi:MAG: molybdopterin cofactor-binding domain-containing protein [Puniceicoccaceae bacterium]